ncbi:putative DNA-directed RNA polymerase I subunit RPA34 [Apostichopus japonicus]|uniref:Putative DNA-directed RNA polymerase I subunit RPA34 n=1 Tax=Stichopus japonicus TaxID=307972 RepID=A0A2G8KPE5_STIJA|nr:putative DNA-directed RNA polymerase I subunit RPA34 [Apostichopus japonicus]
MAPKRGRKITAKNGKASPPPPSPSVREVQAEVHSNPAPRSPSQPPEKELPNMTPSQEELSDMPTSHCFSGTNERVAPASSLYPNRDSSVDMDSSDEENVMPVERKTPSPPPRPVEDLSTNDICLRFECPEHFQEVSTTERSQVHLADVADNKELWLIRVPNNFDSSSIDDVVLNLKSRTQFSCEGKKYQAITKKLKKNQVKGSTEVLLPNEHVCSAQFKGHVTVIEVPDIPDIKIPASPPSPKIELPLDEGEVSTVWMCLTYKTFGIMKQTTFGKDPFLDCLTMNSVHYKYISLQLQCLPLLKYHGKTDTSPGKQKKKKKMKEKKSLDQSDKFEETFPIKCEEETDSSFANFSQSTPTDEEDTKKKNKKKKKKSLDQSDKFEETFSFKSEAETDSSFANFSQSTPTDEEDTKPFAIKRMATDLSENSGAPNIKKKKKKVKKEKR